MPISRDTKAAANPTKAFFVKMITRDIALDDCILDLIDNAVDAAWQSEGSRPVGLAENADLSKYSISITATPEQFRIADNCGGLSLDEAVNYAFSFGRRASSEPGHYSIGVYGIGMKRAVFKLGREIRIRSTYKDATSGARESFAVPINVDNWLANDNPPWDFDIVPDDHLDHDGVEIVVNALTATAANAFDNPAFLQNLRRIIGRDYSIHLNRGLNISLNGTPITGWQIELRQSDEFVPMHRSYTDQVEGEQVLVEIVGGMAAPPPETSEPDEEDQGDKRFGWYIACNGRIVVAADKTSLSGWGTDDWPQWHRQYSGFVGIVLFTAANAAALPLTTTKRSVDVSSEVYRRARPTMREVTRKWIDYTNARKQALEDAKEKEAAARPVPIYQVVRQTAVKLPTLIARPTNNVANINYSVPVVRLKKLAREFGSTGMPYREVGIKSFEYAYDDLVGEE